MAKGGASKDLEIKMRIDRSQAKVQIGEHISDLKAAEAFGNKMGDAARSAMAQQVTVVRGIEAAKTSAIQQATQQRDAMGRFSANAQIKLNSEVIGSYAKLKDAGTGAFGGIATTAGDVTGVMTKLVSLAATFADKVAEAAENYRRISGQFVDQRDRLGELAGIMGVGADNEFALQNAKFNKQAGFNPAEGLQFRLGYQNSGQQTKGSKLTPEQYAQFEQQAAELAAARQIDPGIVGDLAGVLAGVKDRRGMGAAGSGDALAKLNSGLAILGAGKGDNATLGRQFSMTASAMLNEDSLKGVFSDSDEVATAVSLFAEKNAAGASESVRAAVKGLRSFQDDKIRPILDKAKIDAKTKFADAIRQLAPIVEDEARQRAMSVQDVLRDYFSDELTAESLAIAVNRGVGGGVLANREQVARDNQGAAKAQSVIDEAGKGERILSRKADAGKVLEESKIGAENSRVDLIRRQAIEELTAERKIGTTLSTVMDWAGSATSLGTRKPIEEMIQARQNEIVKRRAQRAGIDATSLDLPGDMRHPQLTQFAENMIPGMSLLRTFNFAESSNARYNQAMNRISAAQGTPIRDAVQAGNDPQMREQNALLREIRDGLKDKPRPLEPTPTMPSMVQPGPRVPRTR